MKFTPFPFEDTTWLVEQGGPELFMFSTDYPHPEGGRRPFEIFEEAVAPFDDATRERFFWGNGAELLGLGTRSTSDERAMGCAGPRRAACHGVRGPSGAADAG